MDQGPLLSSLIVPTVLRGLKTTLKDSWRVVTDHFSVVVKQH